MPFFLVSRNFEAKREISDCSNCTETKGLCFKKTNITFNGKEIGYNAFN